MEIIAILMIAIGTLINLWALDRRVNRLEAAVNEMLKDHCARVRKSPQTKFIHSATAWSDPRVEFIENYLNPPVQQNT